MKKAILSPLCSAFVIPGLGQVINQQPKKGLMLLGAVFVFLALFTVRLAQVIRGVMESDSIMPSDPALFIERIKAQDLYVFYVLSAAFCLLWIYSVTDAFIVGIKQDRAAPPAAEETRREKLSD